MTATKGLGTYGNAAGTVTPLDHKMAQLGHVIKTAANTIRPGLFWDGNATVVSGKANMSYDVRAFACVTSRGATAGAVFLTNDAVYNVATTAAPGSNSRYDVVYIWQREYSLDGTNSDPVIGVVQGTAAASPTVPSLSAFPGAIELARILVPSGVTATNSGTTITQTAPFTTGADGVPVFRTTTEMDTYTPLKVGDKAWCIADSVTYRWNGSGWKAWESDWITYTPTLANVTLGTGGITSAQYRYAGVVQVRFKITLGTGGSVGTGPTLTLPVTSTTLFSNDQAFFGDIGYLDSSAGALYPGKVLASGSSTTIVKLYHTNTGAYTGLTSTAPFTWAVGDTVAGTFEFVAA